VARAGLAAISAEHSVPVENLLSPDLVRRIMWSPPEPREAATVAEALRAGGAREWQIELTLAVLADGVAAA
jgi:ribonuclease D